MGYVIDLAGKRFGRLIVAKRGHTDLNRVVFWECKCDCGNIKSIRGISLRRGETNSCGCIHTEFTLKWRRKHGESTKGNTDEYRAWKAMRKRCLNEKYEHYKDYGGRGISVSKEWMESFNTFLQDMGRRPSKKHSLDRINVNGNYEKGNCKWSTQMEQTKNKRNNVWVEYNGERHIVSEWARILKSSPSVISNMMKRNSFEYAYNYFINKHG